MQLLGAFIIAGGTTILLIAFIFVICKWVLFGHPDRDRIFVAPQKPEPTRPSEPIRSSVVCIIEPPGQIAMARCAPGSDAAAWVVVVQPAEQEN